MTAAESSGTAAALPVWPGVAAALFVALVYLALASGGTFRFRPSAFPHHVLVADGWVHGQLYVRDEIIAARVAEFYERKRLEVERSAGRPLSEAEWENLRARIKAWPMHDWALVDGHYYGYWPPMASLLLAPYVALAGPEASDMLVSSLVGAATVLLTFLMLREAARHGFVPISAAAATALSLLLGLGTVHFYLAVLGQVWFFSQIVETFFLTLSILLLLRAGLRPLGAMAAGAALGAAFLTRNNAIATAPFFLFALRALADREARPWRRAFVQGLWFSLPLIAAAGINAGYNYVRFGDPLESGWAWQTKTLANSRFLPDYLAHGIFSLHYLGRNLYSYALNPLPIRHPASGALTFDPTGNSMFVITPALLYLFRAWRRDWFTLGAWLGFGTGLLLLLLFIGTGWYQFGNRYLLDVMPLAILLVAIGMRGRLTVVSIALIALSIAVNCWGTYRFFIEQS